MREWEEWGEMREWEEQKRRGEHLSPVNCQLTNNETLNLSQASRFQPAMISSYLLLIGDDIFGEIT